MKINKSVLWGLIFILLILYLILPKMWQVMYPLRYSEQIFTNADIYNVDPFLIAAVIREESKFNPNAISSKGAMGLMQLMPSTAYWATSQMGIDNIKEEDLLNPDINIKIGTWYIANLSREFKDDLPLIIASYNGGRGRVREWIDRGVWDGTYENRDDIPFKETRFFLKKVFNSYRTYTNLYSEQ